jgi:hypothetical protein
MLDKDHSHHAIATTNRTTTEGRVSSLTEQPLVAPATVPDVAIDCDWGPQFQAQSCKSGGPWAYSKAQVWQGNAYCMYVCV